MDKKVQQIDIVDMPFAAFSSLVEVCYADGLQEYPQQPSEFLVMVREFIPTSFKCVLSSFVRKGEEVCVLYCIPAYPCTRLYLA